MERKAEVAERDIDKYYKCIYMEDKIGQEFKGIISSVTHFGFFVELPDTVEGLVSIESLTEDRYEYNENTHELIGQGVGTEETHIIAYRVGDEVTVKLDSVNADAREINFIII
jgi:ribonuclease R